MREYRDGVDNVYVEKRSSAGSIIGVILILAIVVVVVLFATGFWSVNVTGGSLPKVLVTTQQGSMPVVTMHSKQVVVESTPQVVTVPQVVNRQKTVNVPTVVVKNQDNH